LLQLRPLHTGDLEALFAVASDPKIWEQHPEWDRFREPVFRIFFEDALQSGGALVAIDKKSGKIIGSSRFHGYDAERSEIEIGWSFLARDFWGGTYNKEMKELMLDHAHQYIDTVIFKVGPHNLRSQKAMEKIGGRRSGARKDDTGLVSMVYEIRKSF
jgi:RimJ/RimL family protein N-acetyltransferase